MTDVVRIVNGERRLGRSTLGVINPDTGEIQAEIPDCSGAQLDEAFRAAAGAFEAGQIDERTRRDALRGAADSGQRSVSSGPSAESPDYSR